MGTYKKQTLLEWCLEDPGSRGHLLNEWDDEKNLKEGYTTENILRSNHDFKAHWKCSKCGREFVQAVANRTYHGHGCNVCKMYERHKSILGKSFGNLTVVKELGRYKKPGNEKENWYVLCKCSACGKTKEMPESSLTKGGATSCGCIYKRDPDGPENAKNIFIVTCNANGKKFAGFTTVDIKTALNGGKRLTRNTYDTNLADDIKRYGWENFSFEKVDTAKDRAEAMKKVQEIVNKYGLTDPEKGYNARYGAKKRWSWKECHERKVKEGTSRERHKKS